MSVPPSPYSTCGNNIDILWAATVCAVCSEMSRAGNDHKLRRLHLFVRLQRKTRLPPVWLSCFSKNLSKNMMFVDPSIIVQFIQKNPTRCNSASKFIIPYLYEAQHVSGETPPIIRSLKLHWQPLGLHTLKVVGRFGWHTFRHQEPKTALASSRFAYVKGCWTFRVTHRPSSGA
jgi:hypothetical protein